MREQGSGNSDQGSEPRVPQVPAVEPEKSRVPQVPRTWAPGIPQNWASQTSRRTFGWLLILAAAALAVAPQAIWGNSCGHDFDFHLVSWLDALNAWRHGILYPHWTPSANYGAGEPRFVFYSPLTWMLGAALGAAMPWTAVPLVMTFLLLAGTGLATRSLAREGLGGSAATLAGCIAIFSGYALFTAYERSAFAELAGGLWIPLVLKYALPRAAHPSVSAHANRFFDAIFGDGSIVPLALAIAASWLSNPTVGVMACYTLAAIAILRLVLERSWRPVLRATAGAALGLGLSAFYLLPAAYEQRWVDIHQVTEDPGQTLENNWLFARHANPSLALHDQVLHTVSILAVVMIAFTLAALLFCWLQRRLPYTRQSAPSVWWVALALIPVAVLFLQFPFSRPIWNLLPDLRFLQFPWRWLLVLEPAMAIFIAASVWPRRTEQHSPRIAVGCACATIFLALTTYAARDLYQPCEADDAVPDMLSTYQAGQGFEGTYEYEPIGADISTTAINLPDACLARNPKIELGKLDQNGDMVWAPGQGACDATYPIAGINPEHLLLAAAIPHPGFLVLRLLSYPAWQIKVNERAAVPLPKRDDGLIAVAVPAGRVLLTADWTTTPDVALARWLTLFGILLLIAAVVLTRKFNRTRV